jgi:hypothetical protein
VIEEMFVCLLVTQIIMNHVIKSRDVVWSIKTYGEWIKSKDNLKLTDDDLSDTEVDADNHKGLKEPESPAKRNETANNTKALKQISKLKSCSILIRQDSWKCKILEGTW